MPDSTILICSEATPSDVERVREFIRRLNSPHLVLYSAEVQQKAAETGFLFKVELPDREIVATAIIVPLGKQPFWEFGNIGVGPDWRGFRLQDQLTFVAAGNFVAEAGFDDRLVSGVDSSNTPSKKNLLGAGFTPLTATIPELFIACNGCSKRTSLPIGKQCCSDFLLLDKNAHRQLISKFLVLGTTTALSNKQKTKQVLLRFDCRCATDPDYRTILEDFAA